MLLLSEKQATILISLLAKMYESTKGLDREACAELYEMPYEVMLEFILDMFVMAVSKSIFK